MKRMSIHLVVSLTFLLSALALYSRVAPAFAPPPPAETVCRVEVAQTVAPVAAPQEFQVEGVWEQYSIDPDGRRDFMARLEIRKDGAHYLAHPVSIAEFSFPKQTYRSYDHQFQDGIWTFREEWDEGEVGEFFLERNAEGEYVGSARHLHCPASFDTVFVRVSP